MINDLEFTGSAIRDIYNVSGFPLGIAVLGYISETATKSGYVVIDELYNELPLDKGQRVAEIPIIGRNTPVLQMFGGQGLKFATCYGQFLGPDAHERYLQLAGLCDAGDPIWFACDKWLRKVVISVLRGTMVTHHTHYEIQFDLIKYEDIEILRYMRDVEDLAPFPEYTPGDVQTPGAGDGSGQNDAIGDVGANPGADIGNPKPGEPWKDIKDPNGRTLFRVPTQGTCRMVTLKAGDDWGELIRSNYGGRLTVEDVQLIRTAIKVYNRIEKNIHDSEYNDAGGILNPAVSFTVCFPTEIVFPANESREELKYMVRKR